MIYFNQISYLWKEVIASLHYRYKYYANANFMPHSSSAPIVHFRLGRMTTVTIKLVEGNIKRQFLIFFFVKKSQRKICVSDKRSVGQRLDTMTYVLKQCS